MGMEGYRRHIWAGRGCIGLRAHLGARGMHETHLGEAGRAQGGGHIWAGRGACRRHWAHLGGGRCTGHI